LGGPSLFQARRSATIIAATLRDKAIDDEERMIADPSDHNAATTLRSEQSLGPLVLGALALVAIATVAASPATAGNLAVSGPQPRQEETIGLQMSKAQFRRLVQSDPALLGRSDATPVDVLVKLDYDPVATYEGDVPGLAATSPSTSGKKLTENKAAVDAYTTYVAARESGVVAQIREKIPAATVRQSLRLAYGGVSMTLPANKVGDLLSIEGVVAVQQDFREKPLPAVPK
jgi:hypothetical protein